MKRSERANSKAPTIDGRILALCVSFALRHGMEIDEIESLTGISGLELMSTDGRPAERALPTMWRALAKLHPGVPIALELARSAPYSIMGDLGHGAQFAENLAEALRTLVSHRVLFADRLTIEFEEGESESVFATSHPLDGMAEGMLSEIGLGLAWRFIGEISSEPVPTPRVEFMHAPHADEEQYARYFGPSVNFGCPRNALIFPTANLQIATSQASATLFAFAEAHLQACRDRLESRAVHVDLRALVHAVNENAARGRFDTLSASSSAGMSLRSAQRVTAEHGTSLTQMVQEAREEIARGALKDPRMSVESASRLAGYADERSFRRAFRSWTGVSPAEFRRSSGSSD